MTTEIRFGVDLAGLPDASRVRARCRCGNWSTLVAIDGGPCMECVSKRGLFQSDFEPGTMHQPVETERQEDR